MEMKLKKFAATLHYHSPQAYRFVRHYMTLPNPSTIRSWMKSSDCGPGFNVDVIARLGTARAADRNNVMTDIVMIIDEMSIRKGLAWDNAAHCTVGHVDYGTSEIVTSDDTPLATAALVCMIAGISGGWKCPIGYIFTDKVSGETQNAFLEKAFVLLEQQNFNIWALISDGCSSNVSLFDSYGISDKVIQTEVDMTRDFACSFQNPANVAKQVYATYDVVHMMKLWRNLLSHSYAKGGRITLKDGRCVSWGFIEALYKLQTAEQIRAANKLGRYHIDFFNNKMNVKLAVQSLSKSVADAISFCRDSLKLKDFLGSEGTTDFIYLLDKTFDILNSRHRCQKGFKSPLSRSNLDQKVSILNEFCNVVSGMSYIEIRDYKKTGKRTEVEKRLIDSERKRAAVGMIICIKSVLVISRVLLFRDISPLHYVLTYTFTQDPLEIFFGTMRRREGNNNNPSVVGFKNSMKNIWHQNLLKSVRTGNCLVPTGDGQVPGGLLPADKTG